MDIVYLLVALSTVLALAIIVVLWWAVEHDQFTELDSFGQMALDEQDASKPPPPT